MYKCAVCYSDFNDGVKCSACGNNLDFNCANISESGWRKLGVERRAVWKCSSCKGLSPTPTPVATKEHISLESLMREIREIKLKLTDLPALIENVRSIKDEVLSLRASCDYSSARIEEFDDKMAIVESTVTEVQQKQGLLESALAEVQGQVYNSEQRSRLNNVEIKGVPQSKDENLFQIIDKISAKAGYNLPKTQINYVSRVPSYNSKEKSIIVSFINRYVKEEFIASARALKIIKAEDLGFQDKDGKIFVNDHLTSDTKLLLNKVRQIAKEKKYSFV
ncbi:uncharacterized protein LOC113506043 [Trichoplusia ni]|uniref:Uncharacterized protein LOC113506043 n=1 Tax=Trichoplusia ni TaxID=7111 RepID=A0A7E5WV42_TRINI|nr:uncharacterized protein LOC113506043 [Trichoplusia ni]